MQRPFKCWNYTKCAYFHGSPANIRITLYFFETTITGLHYAADNIGLSSFTIFTVGSIKLSYFCKSEWRFDRSRSSKVIDFGANWKRACDFLSVCDSNLGHYLAPFRSYGTFYVLLAPSQFHPNFGGVPVGTDSPCWVSLSRALSY